MGTGSRNFIRSTDFPSERSGTHLKKKSYVGMFFLAISTPNCMYVMCSKFNHWLTSCKSAELASR